MYYMELNLSKDDIDILFKSSKQETLMAIAMETSEHTRCSWLITDEPEEGFESVYIHVEDPEAGTTFTRMASKKGPIYVVPNSKSKKPH